MRRVLRRSDGSVSVEFAIVGPVFLLMVLGIIVAALMLWSKAAIQSAAAQTARCVALSSADCANPTAYVSTVMDTWGASGFLRAVTVSVAPNTACDKPNGRYASVTVTGIENLGVGYVSQFANITLTARACFPTGA